MHGKSSGRASSSIARSDNSFCISIIRELKHEINKPTLTHLPRRYIITFSKQFETMDAVCLVSVMRQC